MPAWSCFNCSNSVNMINNWLNVPPAESFVYAWNKNHPVWSVQLVSSSHLSAVKQQCDSYVLLICLHKKYLPISHRYCGRHLISRNRMSKVTQALRVEKIALPLVKGTIKKCFPTHCPLFFPLKSPWELY